MKFMLIFAGIYLIKTIKCHESASFESTINGVDMNPLYDTIIFNDIADIMKEFESKNIPLLTKIAKEESESDENVEDLLREYQEYLDKEHKQRKEYIDRTKTKSKVPLLRHDRLTKINGNGVKYNDYYKNGYYNLQNTYTKNALDNLFSLNQKSNQYNTLDLTTTLPRDSMETNSYKKIVVSEDGPIFQKMAVQKLISCCKSGVYMPTNSCKLCMSKDHSRSKFEPRVSITADEKRSDILESNNGPDAADSDDALNIRIKIDVQLPKVHDRLEKHQNNFGPDDSQKEFPLAFKMPPNYYNIPVPLNLFGYKRISKSYSSPIHKLTIKKKKLLPGGKKHKKKLITFHNIKMDPQQIYEAHFGKSKGIMEETPSTDPTEPQSTTATLNISTTTKHLENTIVNETQTEESIILLVNISNTEEAYKTNNSIETEYINPKSNVTTVSSLRLRRKRGISTDKNIPSTVFPIIKNVTVNLTKTLKLDGTKPFLKTTIVKKTGLIKIPQKEKHNVNLKKVSKDTKSINIEEDLLFWPNKNGSQSQVVSKNITTIILESEIKKGKLNLTKESMRKNRTRVLEKAIFGDVDWNNVDAVAPAFLSFIGKYIEGALTFCSDSICHSMKCGHKICQHRVCTPNNRFNNKGHCMGSNNTDSVATMESIMDLPTNIAFEIVDILQDKMAGKLFGKVTLCIGPKCITFASSKKQFLKYKCTAKELNTKGHCAVRTKEERIA